MICIDVDMSNHVHMNINNSTCLLYMFTNRSIACIGRNLSDKDDGDIPPGRRPRVARYGLRGFHGATVERLGVAHGAANDGYWPQ